VTKSQSANVTDGQTDGRTDRQTDRQLTSRQYVYMHWRSIVRGKIDWVSNVVRSNVRRPNVPRSNNGGKMSWTPLKHICKTSNSINFKKSFRRGRRHFETVPLGQTNSSWYSKHALLLIVTEKSVINISVICIYQISIISFTSKMLYFIGFKLIQFLDSFCYTF